MLCVVRSPYWEKSQSFGRGLRAPLTLCGVQERFGRVIAAVTLFTLIGNLLALEAELCPWNCTKAIRPDLLLAVGAGAVLARLQSTEGIFDLAKPARRAVQVSDGEFARLGRLDLIHGVSRLLNAHFFS